MDPAEILNAVLDEIERRVAEVLDIAPTQVYESRQTGEGSGAAAYVAAAMPQIAPMTKCAELGSVDVSVGFHVPQDGRANRVQRVETTIALRAALSWQGQDSPNAIKNVLLPKITDMAVSELGDPDEGYITGGLTLSFQIVLQKPE